MSDSRMEEPMSGLVPRLRFPEFREAVEWDRKKLGDKDVAHFVKKRLPLKELTLETYVSTDNILPDFCGVTNASKLPPAGSFTAYEEGDILIANIRPYLKKAWVANRRGGASNDVVVIRPKSQNQNSYLSALLKSERFIAYVMKGAKGVKMPRGDISLMKEYPLAMPSPEEQQKIAACLSSLDALIAAQADKLDALKTHKKGLMQQLFPREGETVPRLRFPEFREAGEWEEKLLKDVAPLQRGFDLPTKKLEAGKVPVVYSNGVQNYHSIGMAKGPGLVTGRSGTIGKLHFIEKGDYWPHNTALWVTSFRNNAPKFIYYFFAAIGIERFVSGSGVPTLNRNYVHAFLARIPRSKEEQQKIAACLSSLDALIAAQADKLDALKTHKKGLMQQLFPSPEAVGA